MVVALSNICCCSVDLHSYCVSKLMTLLSTVSKRLKYFFGQFQLNIFVRHPSNPISVVFHAPWHDVTQGYGGRGVLVGVPSDINFTNSCKYNQSLGEMQRFVQFCSFSWHSMNGCPFGAQPRRHTQTIQSTRFILGLGSIEHCHDSSWKELHTQQ